MDRGFQGRVLRFCIGIVVFLLAFSFEIDTHLSPRTLVLQSVPLQKHIPSASVPPVRPHAVAATQILGKADAHQRRTAVAQRRRSWRPVISARARRCGFSALGHGAAARPTSAAAPNTATDWSRARLDSQWAPGSPLVSRSRLARRLLTCSRNRATPSRGGVKECRERDGRAKGFKIELHLTGKHIRNKSYLAWLRYGTAPVQWPVSMSNISGGSSSEYRENQSQNCSFLLSTAKKAMKNNVSWSGGITRVPPPESALV